MFDRGFSDHKMQSHWIALRSLRHNDSPMRHAKSNSGGDSKSNDSKTESKTESKKMCRDKCFMMSGKKHHHLTC